MLKIGLTGGIGSGKTTVSDKFVDLGVPVIDTDIIARRLVEQNDVLNEISEAFGDAILDEDGRLDRKELARLVFQDDEARIRLESILHPKIRKSVAEELDELSSRRTPPSYVIIVIPLLFESGFQDIIDRILVVTADRESRQRRVLDRDNRSAEEIESIMRQQVTDEVRLAGADDVIKNDTEKENLAPQVEKLHSIYIVLSRQ